MMRALGIGFAAALLACGGAGESGDAPSEDDPAVAVGHDSPTGNVAEGGVATPPDPKGPEPVIDGGSPAVGGDAGAPAAGVVQPKAAFLPVAHGTCPDFVGPIITLATPKGPRTVKIALTDAAKTMHGPLVFYWHGWHSSSTKPISVSGWSKTLVDMGGILVHPMIDVADDDKYWDDDDIVLADQVVACAIAKVGIDTRRIYTTGYSAGGFQTYRLAQRRSGYIAAAVMYSPGVSSGSVLPYQDPTNKVPAMITQGGDTEAVFRDLAERYFDEWVAAGRFPIMCKHAGGHVIPSGAPAAAWEFLLAHPFGTNPSPYAAGLPATFPSYCGLTSP